jgi:hypothetical protein
MLTTWVARFVVENGRVTEEGGRLRLFQRRRLDEPEVDLHVLAEPTGAKGDDLGAQALDAIGRLFLQDRLSLTGGIVRALHSTHQTLLDWNRRSIPREQVSIGVTSAVVSGHVVYLSQNGPSFVYYRHDDRLERLLPEDETAHTPLGEGEAEPLLRRFELIPGDIILAASLSLELLLDEDGLGELLKRGSDEALPQLYLLSRDLPAFALFAITCLESDGDDEEPADSETSSESLLAGLTADQPSLLTRQPVPLEPDPASPDRVSSEVRDSPPVPVLVAPAPLDISRPVVRLRNDGSIGRSDYARTTGSGPRLRLNFNQPRYAVLGAAVVLLFFVAAFTVPDLISEDEQQRLARRVESATVQLNAGLAEQDPGRKRQLLEEARLSASEALRIDPQHAIATDLRQQAVATLTAMDAIFDLGPMTTVTTLSRQITGEASIGSLAVSGVNAFLLDDRGGRVFAVSLASPGTPTVIYQAGQTYGATPAEAPRFMFWEGGEQTGRLLILDAERKLFEVRPGSPPNPLPLRRPNTWASFAGIAAYDGNFYVLDPQGNQVHRYLPAAAGFDSEPGAVLTSQTRLNDAQALAIDGDIYVLLRNGEVKRYRNGSDIGFSLGGIDRALKTPTAIVPVAGAEELFIADAGNKRIVVAGRDGVFRRQFVSNAITDLGSIAVDPSGATLYVVVGDALLSAPIVR